MKRRRFLKTLGLTAVAASVPSLLKARKPAIQDFQWPFSEDIPMFKNTIRQNIHDYYPHVMDSAPSTKPLINGKSFLYFGGYSYYQLQDHPECIEAAMKALRQYGIGSGTARAHTGMTRLHFEVESKAAQFFGTEDAIYLPSGYVSNIAGIQALQTMKMFDKIFVDKSAHFCNMDGAYSVNVPTYIFKNNDPEDLLQLIKTHLKAGEKPLIVTDGIFATFGVMARIPELLQIAEQYDGIIWIDDAHPTGIIGDNGRGTYEYFGLKSPRLFFGSTLSKAVGGYGGIVPGTKAFTDTVRRGNVIRGGSNPPAPAAAAALKGMEILMENPEMRQQLWRNARRLKAGLRSIGLDVEDNYFAMTAFSTGDTKQMQQIRQKLLDKDIFIQFSTYVGVSSVGALRIVVFSTHTNEQIDYLVQTLKEVV